MIPLQTLFEVPTFFWTYPWNFPFYWGWPVIFPNWRDVEKATAFSTTSEVHGFTNYKMRRTHSDCAYKLQKARCSQKVIFIHAQNLGEVGKKASGV
jgi:hypothetical protein